MTSQLKFIGMAGLMLASVAATAESKRHWEFNDWGNQEGWSVAGTLGGAVYGGAMWITLGPSNTAPEIAVGRQMYPIDCGILSSPAGLDIVASDVNKVRMRILNMSPETDGVVLWRTAENPNKDAGAMRFTMKPHCREWQEVVCHVDGNWNFQTIDRIFIKPYDLGRFGDIIIDSIALTKEEPRPKPYHPDVCSSNVVPRVVLAQIPQADFTEAFRVLDECLITAVPVHGFPYPVMGPGGMYGENWWQLDSSLALAGAKWANPKFAENVVRGFMVVQSQNPDGHIDLWGSASARGSVSDLSSVPRYFEAAYDVARRTGDVEFRKQIYASMRAYLNWWVSPVKRHTATGLVTAVGEESVGEHLVEPQTIAPMDLNVAVTVGAVYVTDLAKSLGYQDDAVKYDALAQSLGASINKYLWDDDKGYYCGYNVKKGERLPRLICTTFDALRCGIAPKNRIEKLIPKLIDPALFNWGKIPITSIAKTEAEYVEATGTYDGRAWFGDVWTMRNLPIIFGLEDAGRQELAAELNWQTIKVFNRKFAEFIKPSDGSGHGVQRYGWSASQYIQAVIEHLFGVDYDRLQDRLRIAPHVPTEVASERLALEGLILPTRADTRLSLAITPESKNVRVLDLRIGGDPEVGTLEILLPLAMNGVKPRIVNLATGKEIPVADSIAAVPGLVGVRLPMTKAIRLKFDFNKPAAPAK